MHAVCVCGVLTVFLCVCVGGALSVCVWCAPCLCVCVWGGVHTCVGDVCVSSEQACVGMCVCGVEWGLHAVFVCVCIGRGYAGRVACL